MLKLDILVLSVHPDDAELGCAGTILKHVALGKKVGIVDLTRGELGTRGSAEIRDAGGCSICKNTWAWQLEKTWAYPMAFLKIPSEYQLKVIEAIRKYQPEIIITNAYHDRHPDHGRASDLVDSFRFFSRAYAK